MSGVRDSVSSEYCVISESSVPCSKVVEFLRLVFVRFVKLPALRVVVFGNGGNC